MSLHVERLGDVVVVIPSRMLTGGDETDELERELRILLAARQKKILLDLGRTYLVTSRALGMLYDVNESARIRGVTLYVCNIDKRIENTMVVMQIIRRMNVEGGFEIATQSHA
ncbi:MAG: STAS domain-containing protein, partial [Candidatus Krumholzibacteriia bacterium]